MFARFITVKPACLSQRAYEGGVRKAKQFELPEPHFEEPPVASVPSRFPSTTSPGQEPVDLVEEGRPAVGRQAVGQAAHDRVADRGDGHGLGAIGRRGGGGRRGLLAARRGLRVRGRCPDVPESPPLRASAATTATAITATRTATAVRRRRLILRRRSSRRWARRSSAVATDWILDGALRAPAASGLGYAWTIGASAAQSTASRRPG